MGRKLFNFAAVNVIIIYVTVCTVKTVELQQSLISSLKRKLIASLPDNQVNVSVICPAKVSNT